MKFRNYIEQFKQEEIYRVVEIIKTYSFGFDNVGNIICMDPLDGKYKIIGKNYAKSIIRRDYIEKFGNIPLLGDLIMSILYAKYKHAIENVEEANWRNDVEVGGFLDELEEKKHDHIKKRKNVQNTKNKTNTRKHQKGVRFDDFVQGIHQS